MGNVNMEAYQIHYKGEETAKTMFEKLDLIAQQIGDLPTFTSDDRAFLEKLPALPTAEGKTVLTAETDDQGETNLSYAAPEVEGEDVAPEFSDAEAYSAGDLVFHDGILYRYTSDHVSGDWDATEATPTSVAGELNALKNTLGVHTLSGTTAAQLATAFNKLTTSQQITSKIYIPAAACVLPCLYSKHYEDMYFDGNTIVNIQLDISNSSATLNKAVHTFGTSTRVNTALTIGSWTIYYFGVPIS